MYNVRLEIFIMLIITFNYLLSKEQEKCENKLKNNVQ